MTVAIIVLAVVAGVAYGIYAVLAYSDRRKAYKEFCGGGGVRMKYSIVKKLYAVTPERWKYQEDIGYRMNGLLYNTSNLSWQQVFVRYHWCDEVIRVTLSYKDWRQFEKDRKRYEAERGRYEAEREIKEKKEKNDKDLEKILTTAQKDIDKAMAAAQAEIKASVEQMQNKPKEICGATGIQCSHCHPGFCEHRRLKNDSND